MRMRICVWVVAAAVTGGMVHLFASNKKGADDAYTIAFGSFAPVRPNLFTADGNGEHVKALLLNPDVDYNASFSRDGNWIVFTSERSGSRSRLIAISLDQRSISACWTLRRSTSCERMAATSVV